MLDISLSFSLSLSLSLSLPPFFSLSLCLSLTGEEGVRTLLTGQRERERERERESRKFGHLLSIPAGVLQAFLIQSVSQHA